MGLAVAAADGHWATVARGGGLDNKHRVRVQLQNEQKEQFQPVFHYSYGFSLKTNERLFVENASNGGKDGFANVETLKKLILLNLLSFEKERGKKERREGEKERDQGKSKKEKMQ